MTAHDPAMARPNQNWPDQNWPDQTLPSHLAAAARLVRPLAWSGTLTLAAAVAVFGLLIRHRLPLLPPSFAGVIAASLSLAALGLIVCLSVVRTRRRTAVAVGTASLRRSVGWSRVIVTLLLAAGAAAAIARGWPMQAAAPNDWMASTGAASGFTAAALLLLLATPWLLMERYLATIGPERLPEVTDLRALVFLPVFVLGAEAVLQVLASLGFLAPYWPIVALSAVLLAIALELTLRVAATLFLPPRDAIAARAVTTSFLAGMLHGRALSPTAMASAVRTQFGMDFSRSWALRFMRAATLPVALLMLAFCWGLTGVTRIDLNERGSYERFGAPVALLRPGLHMVLPWPFGVVRHVELGVIHSAQVSYNDQGAAAPVMRDTSTAEGQAPDSANRLWDAEQPTDVSYVIASREQDRQSFQTVSAAVSVLYRIGLSDEAARAALYHEADPDALVHALAGRLLAQFFATQTLPGVLAGDQGVIAEQLKTRLQQALDRMSSGLDVVTVTIEAIHPPSGAATAYRNVQAAEIQATTAIATERGRAEITKSVARLDAHGAKDDAAAWAAEVTSAAQVDLIGITADDRPYRAASQPFLLERYFTDLKMALANVPLEIVDHRLSDNSLPTIDLRPLGAIRDDTETRPAAKGTSNDDQ